MRLKERARQRLDASGSTGHIHIERPGADYDAPITVVVAFCDASCVITEDGEVTPPGFDFYGLDGNWRGDSDVCHECRVRVTLVDA